MRWMCRLLVVVGCFLVAAAPAAVAAASDSGGLHFVGPTGVTVTLRADQKYGAGNYGADLRLLVENDGPRIASSGYMVRAFFPPGAHRAEFDVKRRIYPALTARGLTQVPVSLVVGDNTTTNATVELRTIGRSAVPPAVETVTLHRLPTGSNFKFALVVALASAGLTFVLQLFCRARGMSRLRARVNTQKGWTFASNWATNFAALFTALGAVLSATAVLTDLIPGVDISLFAAVAIAYAVLMAAAPLVATAFRKQVDGVDGYDACVPGFALVAAGALAVCAVAGQLATIGALTNLADLRTGVKLGVWVALGVLWALIVFGADQGLADLRARREPPEAPEVEPNVGGRAWPLSGLTAKVSSLHPATAVHDWWHAGDQASRSSALETAE